MFLLTSGVRDSSELSEAEGSYDEEGGTRLPVILDAVAEEEEARRRRSWRESLLVSLLALGKAALQMRDKYNDERKRGVYKPLILDY